jgi:hypothetical protein
MELPFNNLLNYNLWLTIHVEELEKITTLVNMGEDEK